MTDKFWHFSSPESTRRLAEWVHDEMDLEAITCALNPGHRRGGKRLTELSVDLPGTEVHDVVWTWYSECLVQEHVLALFKKHGFTGYEVRSAEARFRTASPESSPRLWELLVTGWGGVAPPESGVRPTQSCSSCGLLEYSCFTDPSRLIDESWWDGSDFFMVWPLPRFIFVTERVKKALEGVHARGFRFVAPVDLKCGAAGLGPGRLSHWMPEARARELGEPLGIY